MTSNHRLEIHIPDHDVLRKIGGGAYGEVWLARGVTGAWRAVKVVWRDDFDDERGFEREFEGILQYEPISRDHPGLVNILHVGRSREGREPFYYYVMELGDDFLTGVEINAVEYEARTLHSDLIAAEGKPLALDFCLDVAARLADALAYLHSRGLAHRDVKPSNVIFVGGKAKLADIGLVAPRDQRTFVGTEGFVPPEGPGSAQADIYSLGKVLYEMMTGKDRLQFPELPDQLPSGDQRKTWLAMNEVICDICEPQLAKRKITSAMELSDAVQNLLLGKKVRKKRSVSLWKTAAVLALSATGMVAYFMRPSNEQNADVNSSQPKKLDAETTKPKFEHAKCAIKVITNPPYAQVFENGVLLDEVTPTEFREFKPGAKVAYRFELDGYSAFEKVYTVPDQSIYMINEDLKVYRPPAENLVWEDSLGVQYQPRDGFHISGFVRAENFERFRELEPSVGNAKTVSYSESGEMFEMVLLTERQASLYTEWLEKKAREAGLLEAAQMITYQQERDVSATGFGETDKSLGMLPTRCVVKTIPYAAMEVSSTPVGARLYIDGKYAGVTPVSLSNLRPRSLDLEVRADGYHKYQQKVKLSDNETFRLGAVLKKNNGVVFGSPWENSLGMKFAPIRSGLMASIYETRVRDYRAFVEATKHQEAESAGYSQDENHPVVGVNRQDAMDFCKWLTKQERASARISETQRYKIPSDLEWSELANLTEAEGVSPSERDHRAQNDPKWDTLYFWGKEFPPKSAVANIADKTASKAAGVAHSRTVAGYDDHFEKTAPVGSFSPNANGLYDLCGNVYEWVESDYREGSDLAVVRGGSWASFTKKHLRVWSRFLISKSTRGNQFGFRVILVDDSQHLE